MRLIAVLGLLFFGSPAQAQGTFIPFSGYWSGTASGEVTASVVEKLHCTSNNAVGANGSAMKIILRCANKSGASLHIHAAFTQTVGKISGSWEERTYQVAGGISGSLNDAALIAQVSSPNFSARISVRRMGKLLNISLVPTSGTGRFSVTMIQ